MNRFVYSSALLRFPEVLIQPVQDFFDAPVSVEAENGMAAFEINLPFILCGCSEQVVQGLLTRFQR